MTDDIIKQAFGVTLRDFDCGTRQVDKPITEAMINQVIAEGVHDIEWQDVAHPDCGLNDGLLYITVGAKTNTSLIGAFVAIDNNELVYYTT